MAYELYFQVLSILGFIISLYFFLAYRGLIKPSGKLIPSNLCSEGTCHNVMQTSFAKVFRTHNWNLGMVYYTLIFFISFFDFSSLILNLFLILSWLVVLFSVYLAYALIFKLRTTCILCFVAQIINFVIAILFTL